MGSTLGAQKRWAKRFGMPIEEYLEKLEQGLKRCTKCHEWKVQAQYYSDSSRTDGLSTMCSVCHRKRPRRSTARYTSEERSLLFSERMLGNQYRKGYKPSKAQRRGLSERSKKQIGPLNPRWKGGSGPRNSREYCVWRKKVYERDHYICQACGYDKGGTLHAHHIKAFALFPDLRYVASNGVTLCDRCHGEIHGDPDGFVSRMDLHRKSYWKRRRKMIKEGTWKWGS